jgi:glutathione S-transferase
MKLLITTRAKVLAVATLITTKKNRGMITLHHLNNSRSQRILWLMEELNLPYEVKRYERNKITMLAPKELKEVHPLGKSPVITDGDLVVAESGAIIEYLVNKYGKGKLKPADEKNALRYTYWMHYSEGSAMLPLLLTLVFNKVETSPMPFFVKPIAKAISATVKKTFINPNIETHFNFMEDELSQRKWFAGDDFSAADIQMSFPIEAAESRDLLKERPHLKAYLKAIHARPSYKKALETGGPYEMI